MKPIIIYNSIIPRIFKSEASMIFPFVFVKSAKKHRNYYIPFPPSIELELVEVEYLEQQKHIRHETIHFNQCIRYWVIGFYLLNAYYNIRYGYAGNPFEIEAHEGDSHT